MVQTKPDDERDQRLFDDIASHGWHMISIGEDDDGPAYSFTVGVFHSFGFPEICLAGISDIEVAGQILNAIVETMKEGETLDDWVASDEILEDYTCVFREVPLSLHEENFGYAVWYYERAPFPVLQCVWPDADGFYPWNEEFDAASVDQQPVLSGDSEWPFLEAKNLGVITTSRVLEEGLPILLVAHEDDGDWQFLCGTTNDLDHAQFVGLESLLELDPTLAQLHDLPRGWSAQRDDPSDDWERTKA